MPATRTALGLTNAYRWRLLLLRQRAVSFIRNRWVLDLDDLNASYRAWLAASAMIVEAAQREGLTLTEAYLASFLSMELGETAQVELEDSAGLARDGRLLTEALFPPLLTLRLVLGQGRGAEMALRMALNRAARITAAEVSHTPRAALSDAIKRDERIRGWRRVTGVNPCGACLADARGLQRPEEPLRIHGSCRCTKEPVVAGVPERFRRPSGREIFERLSRPAQDALFDERGGAEKAELIRSGQVPLEALAASSPMATTDDEITEAPLAALR